MGQKVSPVGLRIGINKDWESKWYASNKDFKEYLTKDIKIREYFDKNLKDAGIAIRSTFIVGFPGESGAEFNKLVKFLKNEKLENVGFFAYSNEVGTQAYSMPNQISESEKLKRLNKVQKVQEGIYVKAQKKKRGQLVDVMIDEKLEENLYLGRTSASSYTVDSVITVVALHNLQPGQIIKVRVTGSHGIDLMGEEENEKHS